jgi:ParB/RepB/Spo0J family partition protein
MSKVIFQEIPIQEICPNPHNPRKGFAGPKFDELVESIKQKGIIEPIIVRPIKGKKTPYEIVAGERRFKAAQALSLEKVPAIVRDLTDDEAFDFMIVENLQREDLTEMEEAASFKAYLGKHGKEGAIELAERTGLQPQYIRRRVAVLDLPAKVIEAWRKGKIVYGHLEQLLRVKEKDAREKLVSEVLRSDTWSGPMSVKQLQEEIEEMAPKLSHALIFRSAIQAVFLEGQNVGDWSGFGSANRRLAAEFLGIDLVKEWTADEEYLQKKTKAELMAFGKKSGIFADKKVKDYLAKNFNKKATLGNIKKSELVDVFLKSGINLIGKVPDEILKKAR